MKATTLLLLGAAVLPGASTRAAQDAADLQKATIPFAQAQAFFTTEQMLDDKHTDFNRRLIRMFGERSAYTPAQILAVRDPQIGTLGTQGPPKAEQKGKAVPETFTKTALKERYDTLDAIDPKSKGARERLLERAGPQDYFRADQVRDAEKRVDAKPPTEAERARLDAINSARNEGAEKLRRAKEGWRFPLIRHDWRDVLYDEDPSQLPEKALALGDLTGAQFSYARDGQADSDTWTAQGALIFPYTRAFRPGPQFALKALAVAPSVTFNRVSTNGDPAVEQNTLLYRVGVYLNFFGLTKGHRPTHELTSEAEIDEALNNSGDPVGVQVRAAGVYASDFNNDAEAPGFEVDIEPRWMGDKFALGYRQVIIPKVPLKSDGSDDSILDYQLRIWLHTEGGDVQDAGKAWTPVAGSFFRLGPTVELQVQAPALPGGRALSLTTLYSYLAALSGPSGHESYFRSTLSWDLFKDAELNHKVTLNANYQRGGLNFTKQDVDTFTIGLGILF